MKQMFRTAIFSLFISASFSTHAEGLKSVLEVFVVQQEEVDGEKVEKLIPSEEAEPGSTLEYILTYTNESEGPFTGLNIKMPIPSNTQYIGLTQKASVSAAFTVSIDDGETFESVPVKRTVVKEGKKEEIIIPPSEYDQVAWKVAEPILPGSDMTMTYRVIIE